MNRPLRAAALPVALAMSALVLAPAGLAQSPGAADTTGTALPRMLGGQMLTLPDTGGRYNLTLPVSGAVQRLRTRKGADLEIVISGPKAEELHLHGYDLRQRITPGTPVTMQFRATRSGRFELETHSGHKTVLVLEVLP